MSLPIQVHRFVFEAIFKQGSSVEFFIDIFHPMFLTIVKTLPHGFDIAGLRSDREKRIVFLFRYFKFFLQFLEWNFYPLEFDQTVKSLPFLIIFMCMEPNFVISKYLIKFCLFRKSWNHIFNGIAFNFKIIGANFFLSVINSFFCLSLSWAVISIIIAFHMTESWERGLR